MAVKIFYALAVDAVAPNWFSILQEGGTAPTAAPATYGWMVAKTSLATPYWRGRLGATAYGTTANTPAAATTFIEGGGGGAAGPVKGTGLTNSTSGDSFITPVRYTGTFAAGNWVFNWHMRTPAVSHTGRMRFNVWRSANADGTGATKLNATVLLGAVVNLNAAATTFNSSCTWAAPAITLNNEYLFFQMEWLVSVQGTSNSSGSTFYTTTTINTTDFSTAATGTGTLVATGQARTNLELQSQTFEHANWVKTGVTVTANTVAAPDSSITAETITLSVTNSIHYLQGPIFVSPGGMVTSSVYVKAGTATWYQVHHISNAWVNFNLVTGTIGNKHANSIGNIEDVGDGWYRCSMTHNLSSGNWNMCHGPLLSNIAAAAGSFQGNGETVYAWGAQVEVGSVATDYIPTTTSAASVFTVITGVGNIVDLPAEGTGALVAQNAGLVSNFALSGSEGTGALTAVAYARANLLQWSQSLDLAPWVKNDSVIDADVMYSPPFDFTRTGERFTDTAASVPHNVIQQANLVASGAYVFSVYAKRVTGRWIKLMCFGVNSFASNFDLQNGVTGVKTAGTTANIIDVGDGWYRCSISGIFEPTTYLTCNITSMSGDDGPTSYPGTGSMWSFWGAQLEPGSVANLYIPTTSAAISIAETLVGTGTVSWAATGALIAGRERTNLALQSEAFDAVPWNHNSVTITANAIAAPNAELTADRINDTALESTHYAYLVGIPVQNGVTYTLSLYAKIGELNWVQILATAPAPVWANFNLDLGELGQKHASVTSSIEVLADGWCRCSMTVASATSATSGFYANLLTGDVPWGSTTYFGGSGNLYVWGAQFEKGNSASAYIPTTTAAVTVGSAPPSITGTGTVSSPPVTGTGALTTGVADLDAFGNTASVGLGGGGAIINTGTGPGSASFLGTPGGQKYAQNIHSQGTLIRSVQTWLAQVGTSVCGNVLVKLHAVDGADAPAALLATSNTLLPSTSLPATPTLCTFIFDPPFETTIGTELSVVIETEFLAPSNANCLYGYIRTPSTYANAQWRYFDGTSWRADYVTYDVPLLVDQTFEGGLKPLASTLAGIGFSQVVATSAALVASTASLAGAGISESRSTSTALQAQSNFLQLGTGISSSQSTLGLLTARNPAITGAGLGPSWVGTGALPSAVATLAGAGASAWRATGTLPVGVADLDAVGTTTWAASGAMAAQNATTVAPGVTGSTGTATLLSTAATMSGLGSAVTGVGGTGELIAQARVITSPVGITSSSGAAILPRTGTTTAAIVAPGIGQSLGSAILPRTGTTLAALAGAGTGATLGSATLLDQVAAITASGVARHVATGTLPASSSAIVSTGLVRWAATGALMPSASAAAGAGSSFSTVTSAALFASTASLNGFEGVVIIGGTGTMPAQSHDLDGVAISGSLGTGVLADASAFAAGVGLSRSLGLASPVSQASVIASSGVSRSQGTGALPSSASVLAGAGAVLAAPTGTGALASMSSAVSGVGGVALLASGILNAQDAIIASTGIVLDAVTGTGALAATAADLDALGSIGAAPSGSGVLAPYSASLNAQGIRQWAATGALDAKPSTVVGVARQGWLATGTLDANAPVVSATGVATWGAAGALPSGVASLAGAGVSRSTGTAPLAAARAYVVGAEGVVVIQGAGELEAQSRVLAGAGLSRSFGFGSLVVPDSADLIGVGSAAIQGTGALAAGWSDLEGTGAGQAQGVGALAAGAVSVTGLAVARWTVSGTLSSGISTIAGVAVAASRGTGALAVSDPAVAGAGISATWGAAALTSRPAIIYGSAFLSTAGFGELEAQGRVIVGTGFGLSRGTGVLDVENFAQLVGSGISRSVGTGAIVPKPAKVAGFATLTAYGAGVLEPLDATISGNDLVEGAGVIDAAVCELVGIGEVGEYIPLPPTELPGSYPGTVTWYGSVTEAPRVPSAWWLREAA